MDTDWTYSSCSWLWEEDIAFKNACSGSCWTAEEDKAFENALALYNDDADRWDKIAAAVPGKTIEDLKLHYEALRDDVAAIESGTVPSPRYPSQVSASKKKKKKTKSARIGAQRGIPWTEDEHKRFLYGLQRYGRGDWKSISRYCVLTKSNSQVASHAQKYFKRLDSTSDGKRPSINDITIPPLDSESASHEPTATNMPGYPKEALTNADVVSAPHKPTALEMPGYPKETLTNPDMVSAPRRTRVLNMPGYSKESLTNVGTVSALRKPKAPNMPGYLKEALTNPGTISSLHKPMAIDMPGYLKEVSTGVAAYPKETSTGVAAYPNEPLTSYAGYQKEAPSSFAGYQSEASTSFAGYLNEALTSFAKFPQEAPIDFAAYQQEAPTDFAAYQQEGATDFAAFPQEPLTNYAAYPQEDSTNFSMYPQEASAGIGTQLIPPTPFGPFSSQMIPGVDSSAAGLSGYSLFDPPFVSEPFQEQVDLGGMSSSYLPPDEPILEDTSVPNACWGDLPPMDLDMFILPHILD